MFPSADYSRHQSDGYGGHGSSHPFEMRPPFAADPQPAGRSHRLNDVSDHHDYRHRPAAVTYAPSYKYRRPQPYPSYRPAPQLYSAPVYVPRGHPQPSHGAKPDPFLAVHQRVNAQFEPGHVRALPVARYPPPPHPEVHLVPLPPVYRAPPPPPAAYHGPPPYAHEFPYSEHEEHPAPRRPHARALGALNPAPFIAAIASAYQENEKNFGVHRQGKLAENGLTHRPNHRRPHPVFPDHPLIEPPAARYPAPVRPHGAPYPELGPLYALAAAGSEVSTTAVHPDGEAEGGRGTDSDSGAEQEA